MAYLGVPQSKLENLTTNVQIVNLSASFDGTTVTFNLQDSRGDAVYAIHDRALLVTLGGITQKPGVDYTTTGTTITFTTAPVSNLTIEIRKFYGVQRIIGVNDGVISPVKLTTGGPVWNSSGNVTISGDLNVTGAFNSGGNGLFWEDNEPANFGSDNDGIIKHTGTNLQIQDKTGDIIFSTGSTPVPRLTIASSGAATFTGSVKTTPDVPAGEIGFRVDYSNPSGETTYLGLRTNSVNYVFGHYDGSGLTSSIDFNGAAKFGTTAVGGSGKVTVYGDGGDSLIETQQNALGYTFKVTGGGNVDTPGGYILSGADPWNGGGTGVSIQPSGYIRTGRTGGTDSVFQAFHAGQGTSTTINLTAAGAATFSGKITTTNTVKCRDVNSDYGGIYFSSGVLLPTQVDGNFATTGLSLGQSGNRFNHLFLTGDVTAAGASFAGDVSPDADATYDLGSATKRWANIYSADLQLSNEGSANDVDGTWGQYTIQEGEDDLFLINRRSGKKYKFNLTEV